MAGKLMLLRPSELRIDGGTQCRAKIDTETVDEYSLKIDSGAQLPPIEVINDGKDNWVWDGLHRYHGHVKSKTDKIQCNVASGTQEDARWLATSANQTHGMKRTNADKVEAVKMALAHPRAKAMSDRDIAEHVGVTQPMVSKYRKPTPSNRGKTDNGYQKTSHAGGKSSTPDNPKAADTPKPPRPSTVPEPPPPEPSSNGDGAPWEEEEPDTDPVVEFLTACNIGAIKATKDQRAQMAALDEELQRALTADVVAGNQSLPNALRTKRVAIRDAVGNIVDETVAPVFETRDEFKKAMSAITEVKKQVHALIETDAGGWIDGQEFDRLLTNAYSIMKFAAPYCECAKCRRTLKKSCPACKGTGWVHNSMYKSAFSDEDKAWLASTKK